MQIPPVPHVRALVESALGTAAQSMIPQKRKATGRPFAKGCKPGPGQPPMSEELKLVRNLTQEQLAQLGKLLLAKNYDELEAIANSPQSNVLIAIIAGSAVKAARTQDWEKIETLMHRIVGKPRETLDVNLRGVLSFADLVADAAGGRRGNGPKDA